MTIKLKNKETGRFGWLDCEAPFPKTSDQGVAVIDADLDLESRPTAVYSTLSKCLAEWEECLEQAPVSLRACYAIPAPNGEMLGIADQDYYEIDSAGNRNYRFTFDEATQIAERRKDGWRLPTPQEWALITAFFGTDTDGKISVACLRGKLHLSYYNGIHSVHTGDYWAAVETDKDHANCFQFNDESVDITGFVHKSIRLSIRFVRDYPAGVAHA